ncbi:MAG: serine/threonine protein kinase [Sphaerospermopsis sp. SIO1G2]|nr:serine/threonine protein kinase [Sphaerospermopsis sp. SIO1G2]
MVWQPGHELQGGKYVIQEVLGQGGFGITYKVLHKYFKSYVVIKTLNDELRDDPDYQKYEEKFKKEGRILERLSQQKNNHIVRVIDLFAEDNIWYLVMDLVEGENLEKLVQRRKLSEAEAVNYIRQIGEALVVTHGNNLFHRDAHPGNIMIQNDGTAILIDFGLAGEIIPNSKYKHSKQGFHPVFAPYEQSLGVREPTLDVYTLAGSLYYAVTGRLPIPGAERYISVILKRHSDPLIPPEKYNPHISNDVKLAIERGMKIEPNYRSQSMSDWLELLPNYNLQGNYQQPINNPDLPEVEEETKRKKKYKTNRIPPRYIPVQNQLDIAKILTDILGMVGNGIKGTLSFTVEILERIVDIIGDVFTGVFDVVGNIIAEVSYLPWLSLAYITFYYSIFGFLVGSSAIASASAIAIAFAIASASAIASAYAYAG